MSLGRVAVGISLALALGGCSARVDASRVTDVQRGVALGLFASDPAWDYAPLLDEIVRHGATDVLLAVVWYQKDVQSHDIAPWPGFSPHDATVLRTANQAHARGLRVTLMPIVRLREFGPKQWRGTIAPAAGAAAWFTAYRAFLDRMIDVAVRGNVERLSVGSELVSLEHHDDEWRALIAHTRGRYAGRLLYSANWDHYRPVGFWDALDEVGVTAYHELATDEVPRPDAAGLARAWAQPRRDMLNAQRELGRPLVITEVGYPSRATAARYPWDETRDAALDLALQATLYQAFCDAFTADEERIAGFYVWNWFGFGGEADGDYTPRGKPAAAVLRRCLLDPSWERPPKNLKPAAPRASVAP